MLDALYRLNPYYDEDSGYDKVEEYPRRYFTDYDERHEGEAAESFRPIGSWKIRMSRLLRPYSAKTASNQEKFLFTRSTTRRPKYGLCH